MGMHRSVMSSLISQGHYYACPGGIIRRSGMWWVQACAWVGVERDGKALPVGTGCAVLGALGNSHSPLGELSFAFSDLR